MSDAVSTWLQELDLNCYIENSVNHNIEPQLLCQITAADLKEPGIGKNRLCAEFSRIAQPAHAAAARLAGSEI